VAAQQKIGIAMMSINQGVSPGEGRNAQQTLTTLLLKFFSNVWENENGGAIPESEKNSRICLLISTGVYGERDGHRAAV